MYTLELNDIDFEERFIQMFNEYYEIKTETFE